MSNNSRLLPLAAVAALVAPAVGAQQPAATGTITGTVTEQGTNAPLAAVQVNVVGTTRGAITNDAGVYRILRRNGLSRLPNGTRVRRIHTTRYNKQVPGHHIQMDVKFLTFIGENGQKVRRFQYTAIDDATRIRALRIYDRHTQANAIKFVDHVIATFPCRIREILSDNVLCREGSAAWGVRSRGIRATGCHEMVAQAGSAVKKWSFP